MRQIRQRIEDSASDPAAFAAQIIVKNRAHCLDVALDQSDLPDVGGVYRLQGTA